MLQATLITTPYSCATDISSLPLEVKASATKLFRWFKNNHLKANPGKSHILLSTSNLEIVSIVRIPLAASSHEKLLGVTIDSELKFENHIKDLCLKVGEKKKRSLSYIKFRVIIKTQNINESIYGIIIQLLSLDMDALL